MNLKDIEQLIDKVNLSDISLFEVKIDNIYIKMDKSLTRNSLENNNNYIEKNKFSNNKEIPDTNIENKYDIEDKNEVDNENTEDFYIVKSPMVGTFYLSPGVGLEQFVNVGDKVKPGDTLCIIEAMKLMNEIECEVSGEIIEILQPNEQMIQYGSELFKIRRL